MQSFRGELHTQNKTVGAVILAGGLARRMGGQDKGLLTVAGRAMADWCLQAIAPQVDEVVLNANRNLAAYKAFGVPVIADKHAGNLGPLAGLSAGCQALATDFVMMCPCDSPFVSGRIVDRLGQACLDQSADIAVAHDGVRIQPVFCLINRRVLDSVNAFLQRGERKIDRWYAEQSTVEVACADLSDTFRNINTQQELQIAEQELLQ